MRNRLFGASLAPGRTDLETDVAQTARARASGAAQIVDVREPQEWSDGHIPGATHIPLAELGLRLGQLDAARPVIAVCRSGVRSLKAAEFLRRSGVPGATSMAGGMKAWSAAGQPMER